TSWCHCTRTVAALPPSPPRRSSYLGQLWGSGNDEVIHGIPGKRRIEAGDVVKLDVVAVKNCYYGDAAVTVPIGPVPPKVERLLRSEEHTSELQSLAYLVCRLLLEKK